MKDGAVEEERQVLLSSKYIGSIEVGHRRRYFAAKEMQHDSPLKDHEFAVRMC
jgi:hypothetical protein